MISLLTETVTQITLRIIKSKYPMLMVLVANLHKALCNFQYHVSMNSRSLFNYSF